MHEEAERDTSGTPEGDTTGAEYLAEDDRTKATGYNAVPHRAGQPPRERQVRRVRLEAGQRPHETTKAPKPD